MYYPIFEDMTLRRYDGHVRSTEVAVLTTGILLLHVPQPSVAAHRQIGYPAAQLRGEAFRHASRDRGVLMDLFMEPLGTAMVTVYATITLQCWLDVSVLK
jgi:hypothetical protein